MRATTRWKTSWPASEHESARRIRPARGRRTVPSGSGSFALSCPISVPIAALLITALPACSPIAELPEDALDFERIPTPFVEDGQPVTLEAVVFSPAGPGPHPTLVFNHGATGVDADPSRFGQTSGSLAVARFFTDRGWFVLFPQRRGRGRSGGRYAEGLEPDGLGYSCSPQIALAGLERALEDLDAIVKYLDTHVAVDTSRMVIGGHSRGGALSIIYAGTQPTRFRGVINIVGGWIGEQCENRDAINRQSLERGAAFGGPTLWLYGENDPFFSLEHSRRNFDAFVSAGGTGMFEAYPLDNGHELVNRSDLWSEAVSAFLEQLQ